MKNDILWEELYHNRNLLNEDCGEIIAANREDLQSAYDGNLAEYFSYINSHNFIVKKCDNYKIDLYKNDCAEMRKVFLQKRLNEADTRNSILCVNALNCYIKDMKIDIDEFILLLDNTSYWNDNAHSRRFYRECSNMHLKNIRDIKILKKEVSKELAD